jgi:hypothetical protein
MPAQKSRLDQDETADSPGQRERRFLERIRSGGQPTIRIITRVDSEPLRVLEGPVPEVRRAVVKDINVRSVGLVVRQPLRVGTTIGVQLPDKPARVSGILSAVVRHCTALPAGDWLLGCALSRRLTDDEVASFLSAEN